MKKIIILLPLVFVGALVFFITKAYGEVVVTAYSSKSYTTGKSQYVEYKISRKVYESLPVFEPRSSQVPLSVNDALRKAWEYVGNREDLQLMDIQLSNTWQYFPKKKALWFYTMNFRRKDFKDESMNRVVVLLDGTVVEPEIKKLRFQPEPPACR
jgi:hypothetical protein